MPNMDATATEQQRDGMNFVQCVNLARGICKEKEKEPEQGKRSRYEFVELQGKCK